MTVADAPATSARVRKQYEYLPYPHREPSDEKKRLLITGLDELNCVNHYCFRGKRNLLGNFRTLVAGGGTGDAVVFLAHQLQKGMGDIVYVDLSDASQQVARQRLRARGLENRVKWIQGSLLDLPTMNLGKFDYINCSGVLHHLADPNAGLATLSGMLKDDGAIGLMVYGEYGRTGVYHLQNLFRLIGNREASLADQVVEARELLKTLPICNWYKRGAELFQPLESVGDTELLDLFLHTQDRAYTVPQIYDWVEGAGLHFAEWSADARIWYRPSVAFHDDALLDRIEKLPRREQEAACELFWGSIIKHTLWATKQPNTVASWADDDVAPTWTRLAGVLEVRKSILESPTPNWCLDIPKPGNAKIQARCLADEVTKRFVELADGSRTVIGILSQLVSEFPDRDVERLNRECVDVFNVLNANDLLTLRDKSVPFIPG